LISPRRTTAAGSNGGIKSRRRADTGGKPNAECDVFVNLSLRSNNLC
jgi:hypothetical protein